MTFSKSTHFSEGLPRVKKELAQIIIQAFEKGNIYVVEMAEASNFILDNRKDIETKEQLITLLKKLRIKLSLFSFICEAYSKDIGKRREKEVIERLS